MVGRIFLGYASHKGSHHLNNTSLKSSIQPATPRYDYYFSKIYLRAFSEEFSDCLGVKKLISNMQCCIDSEYIKSIEAKDTFYMLFDIGKIL